MFEIWSISVFVVILGIAGVLQYRAAGVAPVPPRGAKRRVGVALKQEKAKRESGVQSQSTEVSPVVLAEAPTTRVVIISETPVQTISDQAQEEHLGADEEFAEPAISERPANGAIYVYSKQLPSRSSQEMERAADLIAEESRSASGWRDPFPTVGAVAVMNAPVRRFSGLAIAPIFREIPAGPAVRPMVRKRPRLLAHARPAVAVLLQRAAEAACGFIAPAELPVYLVAEMNDELTVDLKLDDNGGDEGAGDSNNQRPYTLGVMSSPANDVGDEVSLPDAGTEHQVAAFSPFGTSPVEVADEAEFVELPVFELPAMDLGDGEFVELPVFELPPVGEGVVWGGDAEFVEVVGSESALDVTGDGDGGLLVDDAAGHAQQAERLEGVQEELAGVDEIYQLPVYDLPEIGAGVWRDEYVELPQAAMNAGVVEGGESVAAVEETVNAIVAEPLTIEPPALEEVGAGLAAQDGVEAAVEEGVAVIADQVAPLESELVPQPQGEAASGNAVEIKAIAELRGEAASGEAVEIKPIAEVRGEVAGGNAMEMKPVAAPRGVAAGSRRMKSIAREPWKPVEWNMTGVNYRAPMPWPKVRGNVIDFHCHLFAARHAKTWFETARHFGIDTFITMTPLEECMVLQREWPGRIHFIAVPQWFYEGNDFIGDWLRRIEMFYNMGSRMAKFHMAPQTMARTGLRLDSPKLEPIFKELEARGMMVMTHMGDPETWYQGKYTDTAKYGTREEHYKMWEGVLSTWTKLPWVGAHLGGNPEDPSRLQGFLDRHPNLYLDCSATRWISREVSARRDEAREFFIRNSDRIVFGSDQVSGDDRGFDFLASRWWTHRKLWETGYIGKMPILDPDLATSDQPMLRGLALPDEVLQKLYHDNAVKVMAAAGVNIDMTTPAAHHAA